MASIQPQWRRIAGIHVCEDGEIGMVWIAYDMDTRCLHLYDACNFRLEIPAVIGEGINARGRWIPIAWEKSGKAMVEELKKRGCNFLYKPVEEDSATAEARSREIWQFMRMSLFRIDRRLQNFQDEIVNMSRADFDSGTAKYPLVAATRYAIDQLNFARAQETGNKKQPMAPKTAII